MRDFEYYAPLTLQEALLLLDQRSGEAKALAGGTDLIAQMKDKKVCPSVVIDVKQIPELNHLEWENDALHIGAAVPLSRIVSFPIVKEQFNLLHQACSLIGSVQTRNRGTMGGNICNAAPSADSAPALLSLSARVKIANIQGTRQIPLEKFFQGPGQTALAANELLLEIEIPAPQTPSGGCYLRLTPREEMDIGVAGVASFLVLTGPRALCREARISLGAVAPTPIRAYQAENILKGKTITEAAIAEAALKAAEAAQPISDVRSSAAYRREMVQVLTRKTLKKAWEACNNPA